MQPYTAGQSAASLSLARQHLLGGSGSGSARELASSGRDPSTGSVAAGADSFHQELEQLSTSQLEELLNDEEAFKRFATKCISNTPAARALSDIRSQNVALAKENLAMQGSIDEARNHVAIVRSSEYAAAKGAFEELMSRQARVLAEVAPNVLLEKLVADVDKTDEASSVLQDSFQAGSLGLEQFAEQYFQARTAHHVLDLKRQTAEHSMYTS